MKKILLISILLIPLMLITIPIGYTCNPLPPPPPGSEYGRYVGPNIIGTLTFEKTVEGYDVIFQGHCNNIPVNFDGGPIPAPPFEVISPEWLLGTCGLPYCTGYPQVLNFVSYECNPKEENVAPPVVYNVTQFVQDGDIITVHIVGKFPVIVPIKK
jgi:hypothetical protein